ncbi:MAG: hypothetical protein ACTHNW_03625 [Mucilaginibacter sp.]
MEKKRSNKGISSFCVPLGIFAPVLNVISTVSSVKTNPANVNDIVDKSVVVDKLFSGFGKEKKPLQFNPKKQRAY